MNIPDGAQILRVKVYASAGVDEVSQKGEGKYEVWTRAEAQENRANREVLFLLAKHLAVDQKRLRIISGHTAPSKQILLHKEAV